MTTRLPGSNPPLPPRSGSDAPDLAHWLTRDLRAKGTPLPSRPPTEPPPGAGGSSEQAALAEWLRRDLKPKQSVPPRESFAPPAPGGAAFEVVPNVVVPQPAPSPFALIPLGSEPPVPEAPRAFSSPFALEAPAPVSPFAFDAPDAEAFAPSESNGSSTARMGSGAPLPAVAEAEPSAEVDEPSPLPAVALGSEQLTVPSSPAPSSAIVPLRDLEEDDLAVLPGRRKTQAPARRKRSLALLALLLGGLLLGALVISRRGDTREADASAAEAPVAADLGGALLPPPPVSAPVLEEPAAPRASGARGDAVEEESGLADPRSFLGGPSVRRYADVPSPTLSRLASEQRKRARQRDEAVRRAKQQQAKP